MFRHIRAEKWLLVLPDRATPEKVLLQLAQDRDAEVRRAVPVNAQTSEEVLETLAQDSDVTVRWMANLVQKLVVEGAEPLSEQGWREGLRVLLLKKRVLPWIVDKWIGNVSIEEQLERVARANISDHLRQIILAALVADWDTTKVCSAFAMRVYEDSDFYEAFRARREHYRCLIADFLPPAALQKLAVSPQWEVRYLVAFHEQTPWETRQQLSQDGSRYVQAMAKARMGCNIH